MQQMLLDTACFCAKVRRSSRRLMRLYDEALSPTGLTVMQFSALRSIQRLGAPGLTRLAEATGHDRTAMWRTLQPLARQGLVRVGGSPRKATAIEVTDKGRAAAAAAAPHWAAAQAKVEAALGPQAGDLFAALDRLEAIGA